MSTPDDKDLTHPLEQVTGEKDVTLEEERRQDRKASGGTDAPDADGSGDDTSGG
ncbi:hypothetical protein ACIRIU_18700 [Streptomyces sp. NPDC102351]|uniref:hypothetical protein n=1 Tax=Streptomyces sp. NPDC102351 TaxID=3366158 RepID=UPI00381D1172